MQKHVAAAEEQLARTVIYNLVGKGIKLLALDFDQTILDIHTCGAWRGTTKKLAKHVRPVFRALMAAALQFQDIHVAVVTYSLQNDTIEDLLKFILPNSGKILIQTSCKEWLVKSALPSGKNTGKEQHLQLVTKDLYNLRRAIIHPNQILLMDDDEDNVNVARQHGHHAFVVKADITLREIYQFVENMCEPTIPRSSSCGNLLDSSPSVMSGANRNSGIFVLGNQVPTGTNYSAQVYVTSQNHAPNRMHELAASEFSAPTTTNFTIPRPVVMSEQDRRNISGDARMRRY